MKKEKNPLIAMISSKTKVNQIKYNVERMDVAKLRQILYSQFDDPYVLTCNQDFVIDIADTLYLISSELDDLLAYLTDFKNGLNKMISVYSDRKKQATRDFEKAFATNSIDFPDLLHNPQNHHLSDKEIAEACRKLDIYAVFQSYTEGYQYEKYKEYYYLLRQINKAIMCLNNTEKLEKQKKQA